MAILISRWICIRVLMLFCSLCTSSFLSAATFQSLGSGTWENSGTWQLLSGSDADGIPDADDDATIRSGHNISVNSVRGVGSLTIGNATNTNTTLTIATGGNLTISGTTGNLILNPGNKARIFTVAVGANTLTVAGTVTSSATGTCQITVSSGIVNFTRAAGITWANGKLSQTGSGTVTFTGLLNQGSGTIENITAAGTLKLNGGFTYSGGTFTTISNENIEIGNNLTVSGTALDFTPSTVKFTATATITPTAAITFDNFQINAGVVSLAGNITVAGNWTNNGGTLSAGTRTVTFSGTGKAIGGTTSTAFYNLTLAAGATITMNNDNSCTTFSLGTSAGTTFTHGGTAALTVNGAVSLSNPTNNGTIAWNINGGTANITGNLTVGNGGTNASRIVRINITTGTVNETGNLRLNNTFANALLDASGGAAAINVTGNWRCNLASNFIPGTSSTVTLNGTGSEQIFGSATTTFRNLTISNTSVAVAVNTSVNVTGNLTVNTNAKLSPADLIVIGGTGTLTGSGSVQVNQITAAADFLTQYTITNKTLTNLTVEYIGAGNQAVNAINYGNLAVSTNGTRTVTFPAGTVGILGTFSPTSTTTTYVMTGNTIDFNGTGAQTIPPFAYENLTSSSTGNRTLGTSGNIQVAGSFTPGTNAYTVTGSTVECNGTSPQTLNGAFTFDNLVINSSGGASIASGIQNITGTLTLTSGTLTTTGQTLTLISNASGTARIDGSGTGSISGNIVMQRYISGSEGFRDLSSAVGGTLAQFSDDFRIQGMTGGLCAGSCYNNVYTYDETQPDVMDTGWVAASAITDILTPGQGFNIYIFQTGTAFPITVDMTGPPNSGAVALPVTYTNNGLPGDDGWNLVGNPYPSAIDWDAAGWTKTNMGTATYIWRNDIQQYASYVTGVGGNNGGTQYIQSSQAFWVQTTGSGPALTADESVKASVNPAFFKTSGSTNPSNIHLTLNGSGMTDEAVVAFTPNATSAFDNIYDALKLKSDNPDAPYLSSVSSDSRFLSINSFDASAGMLDIPLVVRTTKGGTFSLSLANAGLLPSSACFLLEDLQKGSFHDLRASDYSFTLSANDTSFAPKFMLHYAAPVKTAPGIVSCSGKNDGNVVITSTRLSVWNYALRNSSGATVAAKNNLTPGSDTIGHLSSGVYTLYVTYASGLCTSAEESFFVNVPTPVSPVLINTPVSCVGMADGILSVAATGGTGSYNYLWSTGDTSATLTGLQPGSYTVTVTDANGCTSANAAVIPEPMPLSIQAAASDPSCYSPSDGVIILNVQGGTGDYAFNWSNGETSKDLLNLLSGTYSVEVTDENGCAATSDFTLFDPPYITPDFSAAEDTLILSNSDQLVITDNTIGATHWQWDFGDGAASDTTVNPVHTYTASGTYEVTLSASNSVCQLSTNKTIVVIDYPLQVQDIAAGTYRLLTFADHAEINMQQATGEKGTLTLYNLPGQIVSVQEIPAGATSFSFSLPASRGIYLAVLRAGGFILTEKIIR